MHCVTTFVAYHTGINRQTDIYVTVVVKEESVKVVVD